MGKHLLVSGHGYNDPGARGNGENERDFIRREITPRVAKYINATKGHSAEIYNPNWDLYADTAAGQRQNKAYGLYKYNSKSYATVTEFHLDAASASATGGHVIIYSGYKPDAVDNRIGNAIKKHVGLRGGKAISYRNDLLNVNVSAQRGINYRLVELGFITNKNDMNKIKKNVEAYTKELAEAITGKSSGTKKKVSFESAIDYLKKKKWKVSSDPTTYSDYPNNYGLRNYTEDGINYDKDCNGYHRAYDLYNNSTNDVPSVTHGTVIRATDKGSFGGEVLIKDYNGYIWVYGHLQRGKHKVKKGDKVRQGDIIGLQGNSNYYDNPMAVHLHLQLLAPNSEVSKGKWYCPGLQIDRYNINNGDYDPVKPTAKSTKKYTAKPTDWKKNKHGTYYKVEKATFKVGSEPIYARATGPFTNNKSNGQVQPGQTIKYDEVMLQDGHVWIGYTLFNGKREYLPVRTWNGVAPGNKGYSVGALWGTIS